MADHTPTPWRSGDHYPEYISDSNLMPVPIAGGFKEYATAAGGSRHGEAVANAELIVRAVNSHDALVKALDWAMARVIHKAPHYAHEGDGELYSFAEAHSLLAKLRPADGVAPSSHDHEGAAR